MGTVADWLVAIATLLVVVVALRLHVLVYPPKLTLRLRSIDGEATKVGVGMKQDDGTFVPTSIRDARYYHVILSNERPIILANDVDVYIVSLETEDASGHYAEMWSGSLPLVATHYEVHPNRALGADPRAYDLCSIVRDKWLQLHPRIVPNNFPDRTRIGEGKIKYRVTLQARSQEVVSPRFAFELAWDGQWDEDTVNMRRHMVVREPAGQRVD